MYSALNITSAQFYIATSTTYDGGKITEGKIIVECLGLYSHSKFFWFWEIIKGKNSEGLGQRPLVLQSAIKNKWIHTDYLLQVINHTTMLVL